jgi:hypothetical protein
MTILSPVADHVVRPTQLECLCVGPTYSPPAEFHLTPLPRMILAVPMAGSDLPLAGKGDGAKARRASPVRPSHYPHPPRSLRVLHRSE